MKKIKIIVCAVMMCIIFAAYGFWENEPNLINSNEPFIDLDSIGDAIGAAQSAYEKAHLTPIPVVTPEVTPEPTPTEIPPNENEIMIIVGDEDLSGSGELIVLGGLTITSSEELKSIITGPDYTEKSFLLIDCYAEKVAFKAVKSVLDEIGISYRTEKWDDVSN